MMGESFSHGKNEVLLPDRLIIPSSSHWTDRSLKVAISASKRTRKSKKSDVVCWYCRKRGHMFNRNTRVKHWKPKGRASVTLPYAVLLITCRY